MESIQSNTFRNYMVVLGDSASKDEIKLKAAQELSEHFEGLIQSAQYPSILEHLIKVFLKLLEETEPQYIQENTLQNIRKLVLEMIHRLPICESLRQHVKPIISLMLKLLKIENEENVLVCLRIIIELHKNFRPSFNSEVQQFLLYVKDIYVDLPNHVAKIFEPIQILRIKDLDELKLESLLLETYAIRTIHIEKTVETCSFSQTYNILPKGVLSLRVLQELPIIVVLIYQIYKNSVHQDVSEFVPLIMTTINLKPPQAQESIYNKEIFVDFMGAQIKTLSFLAYVVRIFQDTVMAHSESVVNGVLNLMRSCPKEAVHLRKELLIAARHIFATDLRQKFIPYIEQLFDESLLIGNGVTLDAIRPLAYSTLADLAHHVRQSLNLNILEIASNLFSKNVHDETLAVGIQTMSCKLLLNLVDCIRQHSEAYPLKARKILITLLKAFTMKFQTIANVQLPQIMQKWKSYCSNTNTSLPTAGPPSGGSSEVKEGSIVENSSTESFQKPNSGFAGSLNVAEYRSLIKTLVGGVKTITWGCISCKPVADPLKPQIIKLFEPEELLIYIDLVKWGLEVLDIYAVNVPPGNMFVSPVQRSVGHIPRTKEEKEVLEHFSGIFLMMHSQNFQEVFATSINYVVERIYKNSSLQVIANSFLANPTTSPLFATVLVEYLLERMDEMGSNIERSNLYLRLFKLVFGSVSLFPVENEQMLRPHLHKIVNKSMELALIAEEPYNYFLLLRALFRSIGGGSHDLLYQEFLPLLPNLLEGLNRLQSGYHKQHIKDLFVELCLTVPVRLSSLLPYLPMLMDPLVSALNGSPTLISQGLRTLELCVDNLQPDFLYDHIQPVRASLMQALWRILRNQDSTAHVAFRVLGKFGGGNRKMLIEPQIIKYSNGDVGVSSIATHFQDQSERIVLPVGDMIEAAFALLNNHNTDSFYKRHSWQVIRCFLAASIKLDDDKHTLHKLFTHSSFADGSVTNLSPFQFISSNTSVRKTHQRALSAMLVASATKELRESVLPVMIGITKHYTMVSIAQQAGPFHQINNYSSHGIDPLVIIDALAYCMGHEEKELCKPGQLCIAVILETATYIMGTKERACRLPIMQYMAEKMTGLCYERPWYSKMGGCKALNWLYQNMSQKWIYQHLFAFLKAFMFVIMDLTEDVSNGTVDTAKEYLRIMLQTCMIPLKEPQDKNDEVYAIQKKAMYDVLHELVRQVTSPNTHVRNQSMASLKLIAQLHKKTVSEIMDPHREVLVDIIPPKKHLLRHQPANAQIGLMDGNTFCTTLEPRLFTINLNNSYHKLFFHELLTLSEAEDTTLTKLDCYKNVTNLVPLRKSALRALSACNYITDNLYREKIVNIMFKVMENNNVELQEAAFDCMKTFIAGCHIEKEKVHAGMRPLLLTLGDHRNLSLSATKRLSYFTQLFPQMFNDKLSEQILQHCQKMLEISISSCKSAKQGGNFLSVAKTGEYERRIVTLIGMFHQITAASAKYIESLCQLILQTEKNLMIEPSCPYREPLVQFLLRYPKETVNLFLSEIYICNPQWSRFFIYLLKHKNGQPFRTVVSSQKASYLTKTIHLSEPLNMQLSSAQKYEARHQSILIIYTLMELDEQWIPTQNELIGALKDIWNTDLYKTCEGNVVCDMWHLVGKILLFYFSHNTNEIDLLFQLLRALCLHFIPDFQFLRDFLQNTVSQSYTIFWKRNAFFHFADNFNNPALSEELKAKIVTDILIPCFSVSFEKGEGNKLIGAPPAPYQEDDNNIVSVFVSKLIDPEKPFANDDVVRIALLQFACLLVEKASPHIHDGDANNKRQGNKLRRLMTFAWPCLLNKNCVDPSSRYHGHLLLAHIIARLAIHKKIVLQVFHSLLKGHALEARPVVRQALDVLTPAMPLRMEDGNTMLTHWTKKILVEEGHAIQQLFHILQLIVRHYKVYYPVRHQLVTYMTNYMQRLGFPPNASLEHKKLAVELAEVIIKWELQRIKDQDNCCKTYEYEPKDGSKFPKALGLKRCCTSEQAENKTEDVTDSVPDTSSAPNVSKPETVSRSIEKTHCDNVLNFLIRLACHVNDAQSLPGVVSPGEGLSRRCVLLLKMAMRPEVWTQPFDLKLNWLDKIFFAIESSQANIGNISTGLEILSFLVTILKREQIIATLRPIQRGLSALIIHQNIRIVRLIHVFLMRLMAVFPPDIHQKNEDLDILYGTINKMIVESLTNYEKNAQSGASHLFGTLMVLKACCYNNNAFLDRIVFQFMRVLNRLTKEHLNPQTTTSNHIGTQGDGTNLIVELLILSLDLVKNRISVMGIEIRKLLIGSIIVSLIEKSPEAKILKCIVKIVEEWVKTKTQCISVGNIPSLREKSILLVKLTQCIEKKFTDDYELNYQFLDLISYIYRDEYLKQTELTAKLEGAYLSGLRCQQPQIRAKFFEILDSSMRRRLHDRVLYIICSQAWDSIGAHYWIKQCIELLLLTVNSTSHIQNADEDHMIPSISSVINITDNEEEKNKFVIYTSSQIDSYEKSESGTENSGSILDEMCTTNCELSQRNEVTENPLSREAQLSKIVNKQIEFIESNRKLYTEQMLMSCSQLCHLDTKLAEKVWLEIFPRFWSLFSESQQKAIVRELIPFLSSGTHIIQKDCYPSAINTFVESLVHCKPQIYIPPNLITYIGKSHNMWHRLTLLLEDMSTNFLRKTKCYQLGSEIDINSCNIHDNNLSEIYDSLSQMYSSLHEEDLWASVWTKHAKYPETNTAIAYEQMGFFEEAQSAYDLAMTKLKQDLLNFPTSSANNNEILLWQNHWIRCAKELNQWDILLDYAQTSKENNSFLLMECAWRVPNWNLMKQALLKVEQAYPKQYGYKINLYKGYLAILNQEEQQLSSVEKYVEISSGLCMREWRRLPPIVSHLHLQYLQAAQQIMELQEACQIHQGLMQCRNSSLHDMKAIVKTWRNRLPIISDDLSHWNDIFIWRQHHYQIITHHLESQSDQGNSMLGVHASAQTIIHFGKIARKHNLTGVCQESLSRIYTIPSVPIVDCFQKIRQQVKCYIQMASTSGRNELNEALEAIESTNLKYFTPEMNAEFYALKGLLLAQTGRSEDAGKAFSASAQLHDGLTKAWGLWGDYLEKIFTFDRQMTIGVSAVICFLHACRHQHERKSRKYLAKVLWLLSYDDSVGSLMSVLEKYVVGVPPLHWLPWIPQLLCCLVQYDGNTMLNLLSHIGRMYPQAVYFPIRTLYLTLKIEQREKHKSVEHAVFVNRANNPPSDSGSVSQDKMQYSNNSSFGTASVNPIKATPSMWRCSKVMHVQREIHPTILSSLEGIVDQMVWFRESWTEEVLRQLRQGLIKCYAIAFENRATVNDAAITPHTLHFLKKLGSTFGIGVENIHGSVSYASNSAASESLARRAQVTFQDPVFKKMKEQFTSDFDFSQPGAMKLHNLISKLKAWIKDLESKVKKLPTSFLIEDKCRFLSNFTQKTAEVELPGELLLPSPSHYHIRIARFMPRVEIVQKNNTAARRLYIRGTNGQIYPYLVVIDSGLGDARREERVLQLMRMLNFYLEKQKETTKRFLHITVPRVVPISPQMRLADDNPASISLRELFRNQCIKSNIDHESPIVKYYEYLSEVQARGTQTTHTVLRDIFREVQESMVPVTLMKTWALENFKSPTDYWQFRKMFTLQLALSLLCEYGFYLTRLNADMMYIHQDSGQLNISYFKFDMNDETGELSSTRPVPFRLTPNIAEFLTWIGISGPLSASFVAASRCFGVPNYKISSILQAILGNEVTAFYKKRIKDEKTNDSNVDELQDISIANKTISVVNKAVAAIMYRLNSISNFDSIDSNKISTLLMSARNPDNLCRMDPAWLPWL